LWIARVEAAWKERSIVWLSGVRRVGKTVLCKTLKDVEYFDCELPRVRRQMEDPEEFLSSHKAQRLALDEIQRLPNPSEILKIAADHYPETRIIATGSSTLQASQKFRDTLTGRKTDIWLTPMTHQDLADFGSEDIPRRLHHGGLPPFFLEEEGSPAEYQEWMDSFWAKDIQELFRLERRSAFLRCIELLLINSGGVFEAKTYSGPCEISRATVSNYLSVLEQTRVAHVVRPYSSRRSTEIISAPKVYGFDTGFIRHYRGWNELRPADLGGLWEHYVLNELQGHGADFEIRYWRDKRGHEVDFVILKGGEPPIALECKWSAEGKDLKGLAAFRRAYPTGINLIVGADVDRPYRKRLGDLKLEYVGLPDLTGRLQQGP